MRSKGKPDTFVAWLRTRVKHKRDSVARMGQLLRAMGDRFLGARGGFPPARDRSPAAGKPFSAAGIRLRLAGDSSLLAGNHFR